MTESSSPSPSSSSPSSAESLARSSLVMAGGTLVSRVLGLVRVALLTAAIGLTTPAANVWQAANSLPNTIYVLLAAGVLNVVLLPQITRALMRGERGKDYTDRLLTLAITVLAVGTAVFVLAAPLVTKLYNIEWAWGSPELTLAIVFAYLCIPQILFYGLHTLLGQVLSAHHRFAAFMWSPALANVVAIIGIVIFMRRYPTAGLLPDEGGIPLQEWTPGMVWLLAGSATLGIVLQAAALVPAVRSTGFTWTFRWGFRGVGLGSASRMAGWSLADVGISQLGMLFVYNVLAWVAVAAPTAPGKAAYDNSFLIYILPHSLIALSLLTAIYPVLSKAAARDALEEMADHTARGLRLLGTAMVPLAVAMVIFAPYVVRVIFPDNADPRAMAPIVMVLTLGLVPYGVYLLCARVFYSFEDARTPFRFQIAITSVLVVVLVVARSWRPEYAAVLVALGQALGQTTAAVLALRAASRRLPTLSVNQVTGTFVRALAAALLAGVPLGLLIRILVPGELVRTGSVSMTQWLGVVAALAVCGLAYLAVYAVAAHRLGVEELVDAAGPLLRRVPGADRLFPRPADDREAPERAEEVGTGRGADRRAEAQRTYGAPGMPTHSGYAPTGPSPGHHDDTGALMIGWVNPWDDIPWEDDQGDIVIPPRDRIPSEDRPTTAGRRAERSDRRVRRESRTEPGRSPGRLGSDDVLGGGLGKDADMDRLEVGALLGDRYALDELLARRDEGTLEYWSARDVTLDRLVAVTVLPSTGEHEAMARSVMDGARRVASIDDPRLVRVLDVGTDDGLCWIIEEGLSDAESLASLVSDGPLAAEEVRRILGEAASGLESARRRGLHHLYLNPHSVLRTSDGMIKVSGVGVASALEGTDDVTTAEAAIIDTADLVALLYTGLTGRWPGEDLPGLRPVRRLADGSVPHPSELVGGVPGDLDALCRKVLAPEPDLSTAPQTPGDLARQLAPWSSEMVHGRPPSFSGRQSGPQGAGAADAVRGGAGAGAAATAAHPTHTEHVDDTLGDPMRAFDATDVYERPHDPASGRYDYVEDPDQRAQRPESARPSTAEMLGVRSTGDRIGSGAYAAGGDAPGERPPSTLREERGSGAQTAVVMLVLVGLLGLAVVLGWSALSGLGGDDEPAPTAVSEPTGTDEEEPAAEETEAVAAPPPQEGGTLPVLGIASFDPEGDGDENDDLAPRAVDGDPETEWTSHTYLSAGWGGLKNGTGLVLDLGEGATVNEVEVQLGEGDMGVTAYLADQPTTDDATVLGSAEAASGTWTATADEAATGRYLIIWFDRAWSSPAGEVVSVREIIIR